MSQQTALAKVAPAFGNAFGIAEFQVAPFLATLIEAAGYPPPDVLGGHSTADLDALKDRLAKIEESGGTDDTALTELRDRVAKLEGQHVALTDSFKALADDIGSASEASAKAAEIASGTTGSAEGATGGTGSTGSTGPSDADFVSAV